MASTPLQLPLTAAPRAEQMFPVFTDAQLARIASHGQRREMRDGEVLIEAGRSPVRHICSRQACRASSPLATRAPGM